MENQFQLMKNKLAQKIAGEIVLSANAGKTIKKWRQIFKIPQKDLAKKIGTTSSVISDYESNRRKSPGIAIIGKLVNNMLDLDEKTGGRIINEMCKLTNNELKEIVLDMKEFQLPLKAKEFVDVVEGKTVINPDLLERSIFGYTVIDSLKAIVEASPQDLLRLYGMTSERALIFTNVGIGRSPLVALKVTGFWLKPGLVILQGVTEIDPIAKKIAEVERIPLIISEIKDKEELVRKLNEKFK